MQNNHNNCVLFTDANGLPYPAMIGSVSPDGIYQLIALTGIRGDRIAAEVRTGTERQPGCNVPCRGTFRRISQSEYDMLAGDLKSVIIARCGKARAA